MVNLTIISENMENELQKIGLSEYESKVYIALVRYGALDGKKLSKLSNVPQSKIYEVLYRLEEKKFVSILDVKPKSFKAIEPKIAVKNYLRQKKEEITKLEETIPEKLEHIEKIKQPKTDELITIYRGKKNTHPIIFDKFATSRKYVKEMLTFEYIPSSIKREIQKCLERGVKIQMLATLKTKETLKEMKEMKKLGVEVRYYPVTEIRISIKDGIQSVQMIVNPNDLIDRVSIVIDSLELTKALEHYFNHVWEKAEKI